jgi:hypothetical protein
MLYSKRLTLLNAWTASHIIVTMHNLATINGEDGRSAVQDAITIELRQIVADIEESVRTIVGPTEADVVQTCICGIFP